MNQIEIAYSICDPEKCWSEMIAEDKEALIILKTYKLDEKDKKSQESSKQEE